MDVKAFSKTLLVVSAVFAATANADIIPVGWSTTGAFSADHSGLTFDAVNNQLQNTSNAGSLDIALGTFTLDSLDNDISGNFTLTVLFSRPDLIVGGSSQQLTATYTGVARVNNDTASILFNPFEKTFGFAGADGLGSFDFSVDSEVDLSHKIRGSDVRSGTVYGHITNGTVNTGDPTTVAAVPEPTSIVLLCSVVAGIALLKGKRSVGQQR